MKRDDANLTKRKPARGSKPLAVQMEEAVRIADLAKTKAGIAKAALKRAKKLYKLARKAAKVARKKAKSLQDMFEEAISRAEGKSEAVSKINTAALRAAMEESASDSKEPNPRPLARPKIVRKKAKAVPSVQLATEVPPVESLSNPAVPVVEPPSASSTGMESEAVVPSPGDHR